MKKLLVVALIIVLSACMLTACNFTLKNDFTDVEKQLFQSTIGEVVPFLKAKEYSVDKLRTEESLEDLLCGDVGDYILYSTIGNSYDEFTGYCEQLKSLGYVQESIFLDSVYFTPIIVLKKGNIFAELSHYTYDGDSIFTAYFWLTGQSIAPDTPDTPDTPDVPDTPNTPDVPDTPDTPVNPPATSKTYNDFTANEKQLYIELLGEVVPFIPNDDYEVEESYDGDYMGDNIGFYTFGNTEAEFNAYRTAIVNAGYVLDSTDTDDYGDMWYFYSKGDIYFDVSYYYYDGEYVVDTYAYLNPDGNQGGTGGNTDEDVTIITNNGKGLPTGTNGVYNVNFKSATNVKDVTDQGYYLDGCPTMGNINVLVIPVEFSDATATSKGYTLDKLEKAFNSKDETDGIYSVYEYFKIASYNQLDLTFTIPSSWYRASNASTYYESQTDETGALLGDQILLDEALQHYAGVMDLSQFDSDNNDVIDAVVIINTLDVGEDDFHWAYRFWNQYADEDGYYYEYDGVSANDYLWASYQFLHETYDEDGNTEYTATTECNTYTFIHEFSHVLGADDYYDTAYIGSPMDGADMMDSMFGDHNPYTKFNYGWITSSRLVTTDSTVTLTLNDFATTGDTIIIANNWDSTLGAYQEYYVIMYYTENGVNAGDEQGYFAREGVVVYHVNASLYKEIYEGTTYYDVYNTNTDASDEYGTEDNLIELIKSSNDTFTYIAGDTMPTTIDDNGNALKYNFVVDSIDSNTATITFTKTN